MTTEVDILTQPLPRQAPPRERITFDEFCEIIREDQKADLINGVIYMASPPTFEHESRAAMKLSEFNAPEPDLMFISKARLAQCKGKALLGAADLVVEIISPGSRKLDLGEKKDLYAEYGVLEYWVIDPFRQEAFFWKNHDGVWEELPVDANGVVRSAAVPEFWLRIDWLFAQELPNESAVIAALLAGDPAARSAAQ
ncbi:Uma2 family endonuclease [candidate division KSB1 bacterium]|nr:Uma2 family endonuclease [candidate division KSB1 bacterium]